MSSRKELRDFVLSTTRQENAQTGSLVNDFINQTISEINDPAWAFRENFNHLWSWLRRKTSFSTVANTSEYVLGREVDRIALMRQESTPTKIKQIPDELFFRLVPDPDDTGSPLWYRLWDIEGVSTRLSSAGTIDVLSSSASDAGSVELAVSVLGFVSGILRTETYQLNGTTAVAGSLTFQAREIYVSKQKNTTGTITVRRNSDSSTIVTLGPTERAPKFKVINLYPIPSAAITIYVEYYARIPTLNNDSDVPIIDEKWSYVIRLGTLAKVYSYLNKTVEFAALQTQYEKSVRAMVAADRANPDLIDYLNPESNIFPLARANRATTT